MNRNPVIKIDGSRGEGGGQIIRSSLALSVVTGRPFEIVNIRANRKKPGLLRQHLTGVRAAREICGGSVHGAELHSSALSFTPGPVETRDFRFSVGSAGSATLVAQTVLPALMTAAGNSTIEIEGGTHNLSAPPFDYIQEVYLPLVARLGPCFESRIERYGFYPAGGGKISISIQPASTLLGLKLLERGSALKPCVTALVSKLPRHVGERELRVIARKSGWENGRFDVLTIENSPGPGNLVMIKLAYTDVTEIFTAFGRKGTSAERVASHAWRQAKTYIDQGMPVGEYLADQLLLPFAIAASQGQSCCFRTGQLSSHCQTHIEVIQKFLDVRIEVMEIDRSQFEIRIEPE